VTEKEGLPAAVLVRSLDVIKGPGRVCKYMKIDRKLNAVAMSKKTGLWIEDRGVVVLKQRIKRGKRIGIDYAGKWKEKPWRFFLQQI
jgi:DNA-3-methyladenine glycosylase